MQRQLYMISSLGLFYIILIAFFAIPLMGTFVVIIIKSALDLRYVIIVGGSLGLIALVLYVIKFTKKLFQRIRQDSFAANLEAKEKIMQGGGPVEISILNGFLTFTYGNHKHMKSLSQRNESIAMLPYAPEHMQPENVINQLKELSELKKAGEIDENEFRLLKAKLIENSIHSTPKSA